MAVFDKQRNTKTYCDHNLITIIQHFLETTSLFENEYEFRETRSSFMLLSYIECG